MKFEKILNEDTALEWNERLADKIDYCQLVMAFRVVRQRREARRQAKLDEIFMVDIQT